MDNSPKIHFLKNKEGKFYNAKEKTYYSEIINANYEKDKNITKALLKLPRFSECTVFTISVNEFMFEMTMATTDAVLAGEYFARKLFKLAYKLPTISHVNKVMYNKSKQALDSLTPFTKMHQTFLDNKEDNTYEVQGHYEEYLHEMSKIEIYETSEVVAILKAYHLDKASILGISNKVLKNKK
jgi:hypothetical protein